MSDDREYLSFEEAAAILPDGEVIHTFRQGGMALIGADWDRSDILEALQNYRPELSGSVATAMNHGIVFIDGNGPVFVETKEPQS